MGQLKECVRGNTGGISDVAAADHALEVFDADTSGNHVLLFAALLREFPKASGHGVPVLLYPPEGATVEGNHEEESSFSMTP